MAIDSPKQQFQNKAYAKTNMDILDIVDFMNLRQF